MHYCMSMQLDAQYLSDDPLSSRSQLEAEGSDEKSLILHALLYFLINHFAVLASWHTFISALHK